MRLRRHAVRSLEAYRRCDPAAVTAAVARVGRRHPSPFGFVEVATDDDELTELAEMAEEFLDLEGQDFDDWFADLAEHFAELRRTARTARDLFVDVLAVVGLVFLAPFRVRVVIYETDLLEARSNLLNLARVADSRPPPGRAISAQPIKALAPPLPIIAVPSRAAAMVMVAA